MPTLILRWDHDEAKPEVDSGGVSSTVRATRAWTFGFVANRGSLSNGEHFATDADLVLSLVETGFVEATELIAGSLSLVVWDESRAELFIACDRVGVHPLFWCVTPQKVVVSNNVETLLAEPSVNRSLNIGSCVRFLHGAPPRTGETFFEGLRVVQPGWTLRISRAGVFEEQRYWDLDSRPVLHLASDRDYEVAYLELLGDVVPGYLPEGRFGITLSGGLDSTSVAAIARTVRPDADIDAFSWVAPELPDANEEVVAAAAATHLGMPFVPIRADLHWPLSSSGGLVTSPEGPFVNFYSELWEETFRVMRDRGVDVALSGLDGDRLFGGGLFPYSDLLLTGRWATMGRQLRRHLRYVTKSLPSLLRQTVVSPIARAYLPPFRARGNRVLWLRPEYLDMIVEEPGPVWRGLPGRFLRYHMLTDPFLGQVAAATTAHARRSGVDFRHPLLDHRLIEFAAQLPQTTVTDGFTQKAIVRRAMGTLLPEEVTDQFDKVRPTAIGHRGLREREQDKVWPLMRDMRLSDLGLVDERVLRDEYQAFLDGGGSTLFWYTITLEDWLRRYW